jgi:hypothetical protein
MIFRIKKDRPSGRSDIRSVKTGNLFRADRFNRTYIRAGTAVGTKIRVNDIDVTFADRFNRALIDTCTACRAVI